MPRVSRGLSVAGACVAVVLASAGCGTGSAPAQPAADPPGATAAVADKPPAELAREAPDVTRAAGSSRFTVDVEHTSTGGIAAGTLSVEGGGTYDFAGQIGEADYTSSGAGLPAEQVEAVFRNNVLYQRAPGQQRWQEWDYSALVNTPIGQHDPSQQLDLLRGVSDDVRELGTSRVRDADVQRYAVTIDPQRLAAQQGVVVEGGLTQSALRAAGPIPGEVSVDGDGRVRRMEFRMTVSGADLAAAVPELADNPAIAEALRSRKTESRIVVEFFDFGVPVTAQVPDPSLVDAPSFRPPR